MRNRPVLNCPVKQLVCEQVDNVLWLPFNLSVKKYFELAVHILSGIFMLIFLMNKMGISLADTGVLGILILPIFSIATILVNFKANVFYAWLLHCFYLASVSMFSIGTYFGKASNNDYAMSSEDWLWVSGFSIVFLFCIGWALRVIVKHQRDHGT